MSKVPAHTETRHRHATQRARPQCAPEVPCAEHEPHLRASTGTAHYACSPPDQPSGKAGGAEAQRTVHERALRPRECSATGKDATRTTRCHAPVRAAPQKKTAPARDAARKATMRTVRCHAPEHDRTAEPAPAPRTTRAPFRPAESARPGAAEAQHTAREHALRPRRRSNQRHPCQLNRSTSRHRVPRVLPSGQPRRQGRGSRGATCGA